MYHDPNRGEEYFWAFNLVHTGKINDFANGVMRKVEKNDFESFIKREVGYALVKIDCQGFDDSNAPLIEAFTIVAPEEFDGRKLINNKLLLMYHIIRFVEKELHMFPINF